LVAAEFNRVNSYSYADVKRIAFCTFGCRLNQYDTETIRTLLTAQGEYRVVPLQERADIYVVNTCSVTARADANARKAIRRIHGKHPEAAIVVTGCYAQRAPHELARLPGVGLIVGAAERGAIAETVHELVPGEPRVAVSPIDQAKTFLEIPVTEMMERSRAVVKVQEGCNESCTFCIVPQTRGPSRSRGSEQVLQQVRTLVAGGYTEVVLTGVHVGDYGLDLPARRRMLPQLITDILTIPALERLRLSSIEPASVSSELIALMATEEKFARHFHIPVQSGSDEMLARMNRRYTASAFATLIRRITEAIPDCGIGTDVICGFPGETELDFEHTFACLAELPITYLHPFSYSVRPGSAAEAFGDQVPAQVKKRRTRALKRLSREKSRSFRERHVGRVVSVLLEQGVDHHEPVSGWSDNYLRVTLQHLPSARPLPCAPADVLVCAASDDGLLGHLVG
jgi:threonylcarbamoyladenosine tRNA methylthiotransferase MtaB